MQEQETDTNRKKTRFLEISDAWYDHKKNMVKRSTILTYQLILQKRLLPYFGEDTDISEKDAQRFIMEKHAQGLSRHTVRDSVTVLKQIMKYGCKHRMASYDDWELEYPRDDRPRRLPVLSVPDHRKLMDRLTEAPTPNNIGVLLALCAGMRIGEVCALRWKDVDLKARTITVSRTAGRVYDCVSRKTAVVESPPKTRNSYRVIPVSAPLHGALRTVRRLSRSEYVVSGIDYVRPMEPRGCREYFARILKKAGIPAIVFHGLRHTFATRCVESGCDVKTLSAILGHSNVAITLNLYVHPDDAQKKQCVDRMYRFLRPKRGKAANGPAAPL